MKVLKSFKTTLSGGGDGGSPTFHFTDDNQVIVQGYIMETTSKKPLDIPKGEDAVIMPIEMLEDILQQVKKQR